MHRNFIIVNCILNSTSSTLHKTVCNRDVKKWKNLAHFSIINVSISATFYIKTKHNPCNPWLGLIWKFLFIITLCWVFLMQILNKKDRKYILSKRMQLCEPIFISIIHWLKTLQFQTQGGSTWVKKLTLTFLVYFKLGALQKFEIFKHFAKKNCYRSCWKLCPITFPYLNNQFVHNASFLRKFD